MHVFLRGHKDGMVPLVECQLFEHEYQAQWFCIINQGYTYTKINDDLSTLSKVLGEFEL